MSAVVSLASRRPFVVRAGFSARGEPGSVVVDARTGQRYGWYPSRAQAFEAAGRALALRRGDAQSSFGPRSPEIAG